MLKTFRKPGWQHPDANVRRRAVEALSPDDAAVLEEVARKDEAPALRRLALRRSTDLGLLQTCAVDDPDGRVREQAARRYRDVLAGKAQDGPPLAARIEIVARSDDTMLLKHLVREGVEDELRKRALDKVDRESVLRDVALNDPQPALRLEALERIQDESMLERVFDQSRRRDKQISRRAREKLDALKAARERPQQAERECRQICAAVEKLDHDKQWEQDHGRLEGLEQRWQALEAEYQASFEERYRNARKRFLEGLKAYRREAPSIRAAKQAVMDRLEALLHDSAEAPKTGEDRVLTAQTALRETNAVWAKLARLPQAEEREFQHRFDELRQKLRENALVRDRGTALAKLCNQSEALVARKGVIAERQVKDLERQRDALDPATGAQVLEQRLESLHQALRKRLRDQASWKEQTLTELPARLDTLKAAIEAGDGREAGTLHDRIANDLDDLLTMGTSKKRLARLQSNFRALARDVRVMRAWGRFGADQARERLCDDMEALVGSDEHPEELARRVREARTQWKGLGRGDLANSQALWRRFDAAATEAYAACKIYFEQRAEARKSNLERRREIVRRVEDFLASADGSHIDWKSTVRLRRELEADWRQASSVNRKPGKPVAEQFNARLADMDALLDRERQRCLKDRGKLIEEATVLAESSDPKDAAEACKRLQKRWTTTVPCSKAEEQALWERFRGACDAVFGRRQQVFDQERESWRQNLERRQALCERVESLLGVHADGVAEAKRELHRAQGQWANIGPAPKREMEALEKRFVSAVRGFEKHQGTLAAEAERAGLELLRQKAALCHEAECLLHEAPEDTGPETLRARWQALLALPDTDDETRMAERFEQAWQRLLAEDDARTPNPETLAANLETRESLCLRMEILTGVESPPEYAQARMAYQVERLAAALGERSASGDDVPEALLRAWCLTGPTPPEHAAALEARFARARGKGDMP